MTTLRPRAAAMLVAASLVSTPAFAGSLVSGPAFAGMHVYLMRGLLGWLVAPMAVLAADFREQGAAVGLYGYSAVAIGAVAGDICRHPRAPAIIVGHSLGGPAAIAAARAARACGARNVQTVSIDPPANDADARGLGAVNFVGMLGGTIAGARNIPAPGHSHLTIADDVAARVVAAVRR